jgi:hypothetical protein
MSVLGCRDIEGTGRNRGVVNDVWLRPAEAGMHRICGSSMPPLDGDLERPVTSYFGLDFPDQRLQRGISGVASAPDHISQVWRLGEVLVDNLHIGLQVPLTQERDPKPRGHASNDSGCAGAFEHGLEHRSLVLPKIEAPTSVEAILIEGKERDWVSFWKDQVGRFHPVQCLAEQQGVGGVHLVLEHLDDSGIKGSLA